MDARRYLCLDVGVHCLVILFCNCVLHNCSLSFGFCTQSKGTNPSSRRMWQIFSSQSRYKLPFYEKKTQVCMLHACFPYSPQDPEKYCIFILREEYAIPVEFFWVYLPQMIVLAPLPKIRCYLSPSHTILLTLAYLSFWNYDPQFVFTVLLGILSECFIVIAFCVGTMSKRRRK